MKLFVKLIYQLKSVIRIEGLCFSSVRKKKKKNKGLKVCLAVRQILGHFYPVFGFFYNTEILN